MSRDFINIMREDLKYELNEDFADTLTITPEGMEPVEIQGLHSLHSMIYDNEGNPIITNNAHVNFYEKDLNDLGVTTRDGRNRCIIKGWLVSFEVDNGLIMTFKMDEPKPDSDYGSIVVQLRKYESDN